MLLNKVLFLINLFRIPHLAKKLAIGFCRKEADPTLPYPPHYINSKM